MQVRYISNAIFRDFDTEAPACFHNAVRHGEFLSTPDIKKSTDIPVGGFAIYAWPPKLPLQCNVIARNVEDGKALEVDSISEERECLENDLQKWQETLDYLASMPTAAIVLAKMLIQKGWKIEKNNAYMYGKERETFCARKNGQQITVFLKSHFAGHPKFVAHQESGKKLHSIRKKENNENILIHCEITDFGEGYLCNFTGLEKLEAIAGILDKKLLYVVPEENQQYFSDISDPEKRTPKPFAWAEIAKAFDAMLQERDPNLLAPFLSERIELSYEGERCRNENTRDEVLFNLLSMSYDLKDAEYIARGYECLIAYGRDGQPMAWIKLEGIGSIITKIELSS